MSFAPELETYFQHLRFRDLLSLWPVVRFRIPNDRNAATDKQYGFDPKAKDHVRSFLLQTDPEDVIILLSHVPTNALTCWSANDPDLPPAPGHVQPAIHIILSGHLQAVPQLQRFQGVWSYTAGAFHIRSKLSAGTFAARLIVDEGAVRLDTVTASKPRTDGPKDIELPAIIATGSSTLKADDYYRSVLSTYDAEASQFIEATAVPRKYQDLEDVGERFTRLINTRFGGDGLGLLDVGAGAGRDAEYFVRKGLRVSAIEGAPALARSLRSRLSPAGASVHEVNILNRDALRRILANEQFHAIWMCATLVHIPTRGRLERRVPVYV